MLAAIVMEPEFPGARVVRNVCVPARDALIDVPRSFDERHLVGSNEPVTAVAHFGASPHVDAARGERVRSSIGNTLQHRQVETDGLRVFAGLFPLDVRSPDELDMEFRTVPALLRSRDVFDGDVYFRHRASR
jgi:hypothetical protein